VHLVLESATDALQRIQVLSQVSRMVIGNAIWTASDDFACCFSSCGIIVIMTLESVNPSDRIFLKPLKRAA